MAGGALVVAAGPLLEPPVPPLLRVAAPGPWCGASVGTNCSAPCRPSEERQAPSPIKQQKLKFMISRQFCQWEQGSKKFKSCIFSIKTIVTNFLPIPKNAHFRKRSLY